MEHWLPFFVAITALAVVLQMAILAAMYLQFRQMNQRLTRIATDLQTRVNPILLRLQMLVEDTQPRFTSLVVDATEIVHLARGQAQKVDRVFTETMDRLRAQLIHADQILTGALEAIEDAGSQVRRTIWGPVRQASAFIKGVKVGLDVLRSQRRAPENPSEHQDEGLFI
jgi:hypothetical protein